MRLSIALTVFALVAAGCSSTPNSADLVSASDGNPMLVDEYHIGVDDLIQVTVWKNPDLSVTVPVRPDGKISMPLAGEIDAGGKTPSQVGEAITEKLSHYIRDPQVAVILTELRSHEFLSRVRVSGAVNEPASMPYRQGMTVLDLVLEAGGLNDFAAGNSAKLYRKSGDGVVSIPVELADILNDGQVETNYTILPGDILTVPERLF